MGTDSTLVIGDELWHYFRDFAPPELSCIRRHLDKGWECRVVPRTQFDRFLKEGTGRAPHHYDLIVVRSGAEVVLTANNRIDGMWIGVGRDNGHITKLEEFEDALHEASVELAQWTWPAERKDKE